MTDLGKIERPEAESFKGARKLYLVPLVYPGDGAPAEYVELSGKYWEAVRSSLESLDSRLGPVKRIYHEVLLGAGDEGLKALEKVSRASHDIARAKIARTRPSWKESDSASRSARPAVSRALRRAPCSSCTSARSASASDFSRARPMRVKALRTFR